MKRAGIIVGLAVVILLAILGYLWLSGPEPRGPVTAEVAPEVAPGTPPPQVPDTQAPDMQAPDTQAPDTQAPDMQAPDTQAPDTQAPEPQIARVEPKAAPAPEPVVTSTAPKPSVKAREAAPSQDKSAPAPVVPSFDVVRVEPSGEAVIAGRAAAGSLVVLLDGERRLAEVTADANGQWVIVLETPLAPGSHELGLESHLSSGEILLSENVIVISVPAPAQIAAQTPAAPAAVTPTTPPAAVSSAPSAEVESDTGAAPSRTAQSRVAAAGETVRPLAVLMPRTGEGPSRILQKPEPVPADLGEGALLLETVDYDGDGNAVIGGRAMPGVMLIIYLDGAPAGRAVVGADGRWQAQLKGQVPYGVHRLRVDQVDGSGRVVARVESPFSRAAMVAGLANETAVIVQPGNSLWRIARRIYGEGPRYAVIYEANKEQIGDPDLIYPGQIFVVPEPN